MQHATVRIVVAFLTGSIIAGSAFAQRAATEAQARYYIYSGFITHATPGLLSERFAVGPQLAQQLALPAGADNEKVYTQLLAMTDGKKIEVRKASDEERAGFGVPDGFNPQHPLYIVNAGDIRLFVQYDLKDNTVPYVALPGDARPPATLAGSRSGAPGSSVSTFVWTGLFGYNRSALSAEELARLDAEFMPKLAEVRDLRVIHINGYADELGSDEVNRRLSEKRAEAVRAYLVTKGVDAKKVEVAGRGKAMPVKSCDETKGRRALIECLAPNRRVEVEIETARK